MRMERDRQPQLRVDCDGPWLAVSFAGPRRCLSWAVHRPGLVSVGRVVWRQVCDADLGPEVDPDVWLARRLAERGWDAAVGLLTACEVADYRRASACIAGVAAQCVVTLGLGNAVRVDEPGGERGFRPGTINLVCEVSVPLTLPALLEATAVAAQARTAAVLALDWRPDPGAGAVSGTGTDCIVLACPDGPGGERYAGLHTAVGQAIGTAVHRATHTAGLAWLERTVCPLAPQSQ